ncbi:MAG: lysophospholipid acyltransferase family protein [Bacteroidetes bacterium]|nr:lysophospholipid acyltransferase family protein [Bacteroidota bacterium]
MAALIKPVATRLSRLPFWCLYVLSDIFYFIGYKLLRYRRKVVRENLYRAMPELYRHELLAIERQYYHHLFDLLVEGIKGIGLSREALLERFVCTNPELLDHYHAQGRSVLIVMGHTGNWEWAAGGVGLRINHHLQVLYQPPKDARLNDFIRQARTRFGTSIIPRKNALRHLLQTAGQAPTATVFLADQSPYQLEKATWTLFLNNMTAFFNGYAALAIRLGNPILFPSIVRKSRGHYTITFETLIEDPSSYGVDDLVKAFAHRLEKEIRNQPYSWLWSHKRWKHDFTAQRALGQSS